MNNPQEEVHGWNGYQSIWYTPETRWGFWNIEDTRIHGGFGTPERAFEAYCRYLEELPMPFEAETILPNFQAAVMRTVTLEEFVALSDELARTKAELEAARDELAGLSFVYQSFTEATELEACHNLSIELDGMLAALKGRYE